MGNFLENLFDQLQTAADRVVMREVRGAEFVSVSGRELLDQVVRVRAFVRQNGLQPRDRCALLGPNSIRWTALDLALMAEGAIVVPLYSRQAPAELAVMMKDCRPRFFFVSDAALGEGVAQAWSEAPRRVSFDEALGPVPADQGISDAPNPRNEDDLVTIIYTSGTSGEPKGVCLNTRNLNHMLSCTTGWMDRLDWKDREPMRVFQYLPCNFAASWIVMLSCLTRETVLTLSTDLNKVADEIRFSAPHYFFNVPALLERVRRGVEDAIAKRGSTIRMVYRKASEAWKREPEGQGGGLWLTLGRALIFDKVRARFGGNLRGLVCGSAPLAAETQEFFAMLGIPIWQVYGLTETCGICTMDDPSHVAPGRVGPAIPGIEMRLAENDEIVVRGPNVFPGYWNRPQQTADVLCDGWFHSGDQGEMDASGNWRIVGRIKNLIVLGSGHKISPETIEEEIAHHLPNAQQVVVVGNGRGYLSAIVTGPVTGTQVQAALDAVNPQLPHYKQVRAFCLRQDPFSVDNGMLTAMGKLKRDLISTRMKNEIDDMYRVKQAV